MSDTLNIRIAVEDWGLYNEGVLACKWFDSTDSLEDIEEYFEGLREQHGVEPYDDVELFIADSEDWEFSEHDSLEGALEIIDTLESLDAEEVTVVKLYMGWISNDLEKALEYKDDWIFTGETDMTEVAYNYVEETQDTGTMGFLSNYIDYESLGRDMEIDGQYYKDSEGYLWEFVG